MASNGVPTSKYAMDETVPLIWGSSGNNGTGGYNNTRSKASVAAPPRADIFAVPGALADENNKRKPSFVEEQSGLSSNGSGDDDGDHESTTVAQTFIHLVKGYMGAGCLSLPWAVTQLGLTGGIISIFAMSYWSSYNCWTVVKLKRFIEHRIVPGVGGGINVSMSRKPPARVASSVDDRASETSSLATTATNVTYPHVGEWAYGAEFQSYVTTCICVQQLAICTVFISFVGENLMAVLKMMGAPASASSHAAVMTYVIPFVLSLSFIPNLKLLAPVMAAGTVFLLCTFGVLGYIVEEEWSTRPEKGPEVNWPQAPLAVCAILYSYEGICLILPIESAMKEPKHFKPVFIASMALVAIMLASVACICVVTFGEVNNGSVTAFLLDAYQDDPYITFWIMVANIAVSLSVLLTYPLQLFPALELLGPWVQQKMASWSGKKGLNMPELDQDDLSEFEPLPPLPEHDVASLDSLPEHQYEFEYNAEDANENRGMIAGADDEDNTTDNKKTKDEENGQADDDDDVLSIARSAISSMRDILPVMTMPGDSPRLRASLVALTYFVAVAVPNVQALISLAGALAGSSTALLIPPVLELAWINHLEGKEEDEKDDMDDSGAQKAGPKAAGESEEEFQAEIQAVMGWWAPSNWWGAWWMDRMKCYVLFFMGFVFMCIGTFASLADIVAVYRGGEKIR